MVSASSRRKATMSASCRSDSRNRAHRPRAAPRKRRHGRELGPDRRPAGRSRPSRSPAARSAVRRWPSWFRWQAGRAASLGVSDSASSICRAAASCSASDRDGAAPRSPPTRPAAADRRQPLIGIVGAQRQAVFGPRGEHPIGLADPAASQIVDHDPDIGLRPVDDQRRRSGCRPRRIERPPSGPAPPPPHSRSCH